MTKKIFAAVATTLLLVGCTEKEQSEQLVEVEAKNQTALDELTVQVETLRSEKAQLEKKLQEVQDAFEQVVNEQVVQDYGLVEARTIDDYPATLLKELTIDMDEDGENETVALYANVGVLDDLYVWDDGQQWLAVIEDGDTSYPLFNDYLQLGSLDIAATSYDGVPALILVQRQHGDRIVQKITLDENGEGYFKETFYKKENINDFYNAPAAYALLQDALLLLDRSLNVNASSLFQAGEALEEEATRKKLANALLQDLYDANRLFSTVMELDAAFTLSVMPQITLVETISYSESYKEELEQFQIIYEQFKKLELPKVLDVNSREQYIEIAQALVEMGFTDELK